MLAGATSEVAAHGAVTSAGEAEGFFAVNSVFDTGFIDCIGPAIVGNVFIEGDFDAAESVNDGN